MKRNVVAEESEAQRLALVEFIEHYAALAHQHAGLLRDCNRASERSRKVMEILEGYREGFAAHYEQIASNVEDRRMTPTGAMSWDSERGWRRTENG